MRRLGAVLAVLFSLTIWTQLQWSAPASAAADPPALAKSAGQKWALKSVGNDKFVSAQLSSTGGEYAKLRARSATVGSWERFTLHTDDKGAHISLRNEGNGLFVSTDRNNTDKLRAQGDHIGSWEELQLTYAGSDQYGAYYKLYSEVAKLYVAAELGYAPPTPTTGCCAPGRPRPRSAPGRSSGWSPSPMTTTTSGPSATTRHSGAPRRPPPRPRRPPRTS